MSQLLYSSSQPNLSVFYTTTAVSDNELFITKMKARGKWHIVFRARKLRPLLILPPVAIPSRMKR